MTADSRHLDGSPQTQTRTEYWYRYQETHYAAPLNEYDEPMGSGRTHINLHEFEVLKHTPRGVIINGYDGRRFVLRDAVKRYACPTPEEALESFIARKKRQAGILQNQLVRVEHMLNISKRLRDHPNWDGTDPLYGLSTQPAGIDPYPQHLGGQPSES